MRILLLNQFFWPDSAATSQLLTDVARRLVEDGHEVHVICAEPGYAPEDSSDPPGVITHHVKSSRFKRGVLGRISSYGSFFFGSVWQGLRVPRPDVIVTLTTPPLLSLIGTLLKLLRGAKHFIWEMDVYPDVAVDLNYFAAGGLLDRVVGLLADTSRQCSDGILVLGQCMRDRLVRRGLAISKILIAENWADSALISPRPWRSPDSPLTVLYSGNLGLAHDVDTITAAISELKDDRKFQFVFAGGGALRRELETLCTERQIDSAHFKPYSAKADLEASLGSGDIGLITQKNKCLGSVVPSKLYGLLAAGRPVLFIGPRESTVARNIEKFHCGWQVDCGDESALVALLQYLAAHREEIYRAGFRARQAFLEHFDLDHGVSRICELIGASRANAIPLIPIPMTADASHSGTDRLAKV